MADSSKRGRIVVVSAPSGAGKTSILKRVLGSVPDLEYSISHTTRKPRQGEKEGIDYHFISREAFKAKIQEDDWVEWAEVHGNFYGTSRREISKALDRGISIILDIDVQGMDQIRVAFPDTLTLFVAPPSMKALEERLRGRGTDAEETIAKRLENAVIEMERRQDYDHVIVNDDLDTAVNELITVLKKELP